MATYNCNELQGTACLRVHDITTSTAGTYTPKSRLKNVKKSVEVEVLIGSFVYSSEDRSVDRAHFTRCMVQHDPKLADVSSVRPFMPILADAYVRVARLRSAVAFLQERFGKWSRSLGS